MPCPSALRNAGRPIASHRCGESVKPAFSRRETLGRAGACPARESLRRATDFWDTILEGQNPKLCALKTARRATETFSGAGPMPHLATDHPPGRIEARFTVSPPAIAPAESLNGVPCARNLGDYSLVVCVILYA
jgi:hypothetical protein